VGGRGEKRNCESGVLASGTELRGASVSKRGDKGGTQKGKQRAGLEMKRFPIRRKGEGGMKESGRTPSKCGSQRTGFGSTWEEKGAKKKNPGGQGEAFLGRSVLTLRRTQGKREDIAHNAQRGNGGEKMTFGNGQWQKMEIAKQRVPQKRGKEAHKSRGGKNTRFVTRKLLSRGKGKDN